MAWEKLVTQLIRIATKGNGGSGCHCAWLCAIVEVRSTMTTDGLKIMISDTDQILWLGRYEDVTMVNYKLRQSSSVLVVPCFRYFPAAKHLIQINGTWSDFGTVWWWRNHLNQVFESDLRQVEISKVHISRAWTLNFGYFCLKNYFENEMIVTIAAD